MQKYIGGHDRDALACRESESIAGRLLVTGGTGFIGGAVLATLIETPIWSKCCFLVRAQSLSVAKQRIAQSLQRFLPDLDCAPLISDEQVILGGLEDWAKLASEPRLASITHVIHSAAVTSFSKSKRIRAINVDASLGFVDTLMRKAAIKRFVNVGTAWCVGLERDTLVPEGRMDCNGQHLVPYTQSKIAFEQEVRRRFPELPFVSARPSIVVGHTQLGVRPSGSIYWVFHSAALLGGFTCSLDDRIDVVPVDWVAKALVHLVAKPQLEFDSYHLSAGCGAASNLEAIDEAIARGRKTPPHGRKSFRQFDEMQLVKTVGVERMKFGGASPWILAPALALYGRFAGSGTLFDNTRSMAEGIEPPPSFCSYADLCASTAEGISIAQQMEDDFK